MMDENVEAVEGQYGAASGDDRRTDHSESDSGKHTDAQLEARTDDKPLDDEAIDASWNQTDDAATSHTGNNAATEGQIRTLDGEIAGDEFAGDAVNYQILLGKIDSLLDRLRLDA